MDDDEEAPPPTVRRTCPATWSPSERGYILVRHPTTGETAEILYQEATDVWKADIRERMRARRTR